MRAEEEVAQGGDTGRQLGLHTYAQAMESAMAQGSVPGASIFEDQDGAEQQEPETL